MKDYKVLKIMTVNSGMIRLSDKQVKRRRFFLKPTARKGIFEPLDTLTFKVGEVIGLDNVSKVHAPYLEEIKHGKK